MEAFVDLGDIIGVKGYVFTTQNGRNIPACFGANASCKIAETVTGCSGKKTAKLSMK